MSDTFMKKPFAVANIELLEPLFNQIFNPIVITTSKLELHGPEIIYANRAFCEHSGYEKAELIGKNPRILQGQKTHREFLNKLKRTLLAGEFFQDSTINYKKDGSEYLAEWSISPLYNTHGEVTHYCCVQRDISPSQELESSQRILQEYKDLVNGSSIISKTNKFGIITFVNQNFCKISGYTKEELLGKSHSILRHPDMPKELFKELWHTIKELKKIWCGLVKNRTKDGNFYWVDVTISPILDINGDIVEFISIRKDVTELLNAHLEIEDTHTQKEIIYKISEIGESRSKETGSHIKRVAEYSKLLAEFYGLSKEECEILHIASTMHDIGKVAIADSILNKPEKLSDEEFEVMKSHASIGYNLLKGSNRKILKAAAIVAHEHHEKFDGTGYPRGLSGEDIHIFGRIATVADVFDALGHDRCYKKAWELDKILALFEEGKGTHFDPKLIDLFMENLDRFLAIQDRFQD